ncbi:DUF732 domain-containing protein [Mycolicibacterium sp. XJ1819]
MSVGAATAALTVGLAAPAAATDDEYLQELQDRYTFLTADQLLSEGHRVCAATSTGVLAADAVDMVREDLDVSIGVAMDVVSGAILDMCG